MALNVMVILISFHITPFVARKNERTNEETNERRDGRTNERIDQMEVGEKSLEGD